MSEMHATDPIPSGLIEKAILSLRGHNVLLDRDMAALYGVAPKALNQAVMRNRDRFPRDFAFQLTWLETRRVSRSQIVTLNRGHRIGDDVGVGVSDRQSAMNESRAAFAILAFAAYALASGAMMLANTTWFGMGDVKFGAGGWTMYWPIWSLAYLPPLIFAIAAALAGANSARHCGRMLALFLLAILVAMEISFIVDAKLWPVIVLEWVGLIVLFATVATRWGRRGSMSGSALAP